MKTFSHAVGFILSSWAVTAGAQVSEAKAVDMPRLDYDVYTRESIVDVQGRKFRKIEFQNKVFYLQLLESEKGNGDLSLLCGDPGEAGKPMPAQVVLAVKVTKRSSVFVEGLRQTCQQMKSGSKVEIDPAIRVGFLLEDSPGSALKNKKIYLSPLAAGPLINFSADW